MHIYDVRLHATTKVFMVVSDYTLNWSTKPIVMIIDANHSLQQAIDCTTCSDTARTLKAAMALKGHRSRCRNIDRLTVQGDDIIVLRPLGPIAVLYLPPAYDILCELAFTQLVLARMFRTMSIADRSLGRFFANQLRVLKMITVKNEGSNFFSGV